MTRLRVVRGQIIAVQEQRFRLNTDGGQGLLLTLHNRAHIPADLCELLRTQAQVEVAYEGEPNLTSGVARRIDLV